MKNYFVLTLQKLALPVSAAMACLFVPFAAEAGTILSANPASGPGLGSAFVPPINTFAPGNDNQPGGLDINVFVPIKRFDATGYIDIEFLVRDSVQPGGTTEYQVYESVDNNTFINWNAYTMELGFGTGTKYTQSPADDGLDFDTPDKDTPPTSTVFNNVAHAQDILVFSVGIQSTGSAIYAVRIDVPDGITSFTLRQYPIPVPEPSTLVLAACAVAGLAVAKRRRS